MAQYKGTPGSDEYIDRFLNEEDMLVKELGKFRLKKQNNKTLMTTLGTLEFFLDARGSVTAAHLVRDTKIERAHGVHSLFTVTGDEERIKHVIARLQACYTQNGYVQKNLDYSPS